MQVFVIDLDVKKCAQYHCDRHIVKMPIESAQLLCSAHHLTSDRKDIPYKKTHINHPCLKWVMESKSNYYWLLSLLKKQLIEYTYRYGRRHKTNDVYDWLVKNDINLKDNGLTKFALAMPDKYKSDDAVDSYRKFYIGEKLHFLKYTKRNIPYWLLEHLK
ncbi:pyrimidine dimer DNA glycosylase/endonuclease V [Trichloromonas sp.]|uniref:pyrimidine dimer DNA glycosylase/endonuclease V n=1 Tax=Trichloromonas sp. TaxID=3069249 RepID=UPI002A3B523B|nr:pyrimidine dimer DNA glycosylase/endonuclease V [Trichloromonas sp.]